MVRDDSKSIRNIEYEISVLVRRATSATTPNKRLGSLDRSAYLLLRELVERGSLGVKGLAEEFHLDVSTVSRQTAVLESKGFVKRVSDPLDGRASNFEITEQGMKQLTETQEARFRIFYELLKDWSEEDCTKFKELLSRFNRTFLD